MLSSSGKKQNMMQVSKRFTAQVILLVEAARDFTVSPGTAALVRLY